MDLCNSSAFFLFFFHSYYVFQLWFLLSWRSLKTNVVAVGYDFIFQPYCLLDIYLSSHDLLFPSSRDLHPLLCHIITRSKGQMGMLRALVSSCSLLCKVRTVILHLPTLELCLENKLYMFSEYSILPFTPPLHFYSGLIARKTNIFWAAVLSNSHRLGLVLTIILNLAKFKGH